MVDTVLQAQEQNKQGTGGRSSLLAPYGRHSSTGTRTKQTDDRWQIFSPSYGIDTVLQAQEQNKQMTGGRSSLLAPYGRHSSTGTRTKQTDDRWQIFSPSSVW